MKRHLSDPVAKSYRHIRRRIRDAAVFCLFLLLGVGLFGVPHVLVTWEHGGRRGQFASAHERYSGWYVSVTGWKHVRSGEHWRYEGCPCVLLIPLSECVDLPWPFGE